MTAPRGLSAEESAAWEKLAASVTPLAGRKIISPKGAHAGREAEPASTVKASEPATLRRKPRQPAPLSKRQSAKPAPVPAASPSGGLDGHWDRKLKSGALVPDYTLDLHGHTLDAAYDRLLHGIDQARAMDARVVLLIAGKSRPVDPADRGARRGAIRAKILDWLAASRHSDVIGAVRKAHRRHGGEGALYLVLKRAR